MSATAAHTLLADQRAALEAALISAKQGDRLHRKMHLPRIERELRRLATFERDMARAPEQFAGQTLGFQGENGRAPLVRLICREAVPTVADYVERFAPELVERSGRRAAA